MISRSIPPWPAGQRRSPSSGPARFSRSPRAPFALLALAALGALLAACGTHGSVGPLPPTTHATLTARDAHSQAGAATLTPIYGARIVPYFAGKEIPYQNASHPVQLRQNSCVGPVLAPLTANAPMPANTSGQPLPATRPDPAGGADIAAQPNQNWFVVVLDHANDPKAPEVACGHPLSGNQQYFDLNPPDLGNNGNALGIALLAPQIYTRVAITLAQPAGQNETWAIHQRSCGGATVTSGDISQGASKGQGIAYAAPDRGWWVSVAPNGASGDQSVCGQVGS